MPPRILALILTLVQSNSAILIGSLDSTAPAPAGASTAAASAARPIIPFFNPLLLMALLVPSAFSRDTPGGLASACPPPSHRESRPRSTPVSMVVAFEARREI